MARLTALLDANVLYPAGLRDFLLRLADRYLYTPLWSADIHAEWMRNLLVDRPDLSGDMLERTRAVMDGHFPEAVVTGYEAVAAGLDLPDAGDRHVLAAAIHGRADVIVTRNLRHFPADRRAGPDCIPASTARRYYLTRAVVIAAPAKRDQAPRPKTVQRALPAASPSASAAAGTAKWKELPPSHS